ELFLSFLASEEYNMQIVRDADALPPDPKYTKIDAYISPVDFPEEAGVHAPFAEAAIEIAVGNSYSPFALDSEVSRIEREEASKFMNGLQNLEETLKIQTRLVNDLIARRLNEDPTLKPRYELLVARQKQIDEFKSRLVETKKGEPIPDEMKIPRELISNPHHLAYYKTIGWIK
ncbi:MAG TPA: hypothetical protein PK402_13335, partial [Tepidisphaeraceae bacterium]|nr:hypothetical protein [Tepidisphaeraceae bacterium]